VLLSPVLKTGAAVIRTETAVIRTVAAVIRIARVSPRPTLSYQALWRPFPSWDGRKEEVKELFEVKIIHAKDLNCWSNFISKCGDESAFFKSCYSWKGACVKVDLCILKTIAHYIGMTTFKYCMKSCTCIKYKYSPNLFKIQLP
jgi:hypothetical protein